MARIAVVGGGMAGLMAAYQLRKHGHRISIIDREPDLGGRCRTFLWQGQYRIRGAYAFGESDRNVAALATELGVYSPANIVDRSDLHIHRILRAGKIHDVHSMAIGDVLRSSLLTIGERLKLVRALPRLIRAGKSGSLRLDDTTAFAHFRAASPGFVDYFLEPVFGLFCGYAEPDISLAWIHFIASQNDLGANRWWAFKKDGPGGLPRALQARFERDADVDIALSTDVREVRADDDGVAVTWSRGGEHGTDRYDGAVVALPGPVAQRVVKTPTPTQRAILTASRYSHHDCIFVHVESTAPVPINRVVLPAAEGFHCVANLEFERVDERTVYIYGETKGDRGGLGAHTSADALLARFMQDVARFHPPMAGATIADAHVELNDLGLPAFYPGYPTALAAYDRDVAPGRIALAGDWLFNTSVGSAIETGRRAAALLHGHFA